MQATGDLEAQTLTVVQAAAQLGISPSNAYRLIRRGDFPVPVLRIGNLLKVSRASLDQYLRGGS